MRVLLIDVNCKYSSTGKIVYTLYNALNQSGHTAAVCYGRGLVIRGEKGIYKFGVDAETYLHAALARITGYNGCFSPLSTKRLIRFIDHFRPDIVHIHELHAYFVNIREVLDYLKKKKIKILWTFHCEYMYTGKCGHANECTGYKTGCGSCPSVHDYPKSLLFDRTREMFQWKKEAMKGLDMVIVTPSKWLAERVKGSFLSDHDVQIVYNGVDTAVFRSAREDRVRKLKEKLSIPQEHKVVLAVAPNIMSKNKGGSYVLGLAQRMKKEPITFVLVGAEADQNIDNVRIVKAVRDPKKLAVYYSMADVFVICSKRENFPTTCLEAQCCGTPVVGFDTGGTRETIVMKDGGELCKILVPYGDYSALQQAIREKQKKNTSDKKQIECLARERFGQEQMCFNYQGIMERIVNNTTERK